MLNVPLDQAEILVTKSEAIGKTLKSYRDSDIAGQLHLQKIERGGVPIPVGLETKLQKRDVVFVVGLKSAVQRAAEMMGIIARPSTATDLLTLSIGMILGFLIGMIQFPAFGSQVGLGNAGGLLVSGIIVASLSSRLRFFGSTPNAARNVLEDLGLVVFVAIVGLNSGATLLESADRRHRDQDFPGRVRGLHHPAVHCLGDRLPHVQDQPGGADGRRRRRAQPLRAVPRGSQGNQQLGAVDRFPGGLRGLGRVAHRAGLLRHGIGALAVR